MWKLIFLALAVWLVLSILKRVLANSNRAPNKTSEDAADRNRHENPPSAKTPVTETMIQCGTCQIHLPRSEAFMVDGRYYCSRAHIPSKQSST